MIEPLQAVLIRMLLNEIKKYASRTQITVFFCHGYLKISLDVCDFLRFAGLLGLSSLSSQVPGSGYTAKLIKMCSV